MVEKTNKTKKALVGTVVSNTMDKTIVVSVERTYKEPRLRKVMRSSKKYKVHDEKGLANVGDTVSIFLGRPLSKTKYMYLDKVIHSRQTKA